MDSSDQLIAGLASGDGAAPDVLASEATMKRDQDSLDDFEHLDRDGKRDEREESPLHAHGAARYATQSFLDMERDEFVDTPRAPSVTDKADHLADKFTDSESDADTAGESPLHRPEPPKPSALAPEPPAPVAHDPTPVLASTPAPPVVASAPVVEIKPEPTKDEIVAPKPVDPKPAEPKPEPPPAQPKPAPEQPKQEPPKPKQEPPKPKPAPKTEPPRAPTAHVIEAEVIFCQMGLGEHLTRFIII